jgi:hypothetical protein
MFGVVVCVLSHTIFVCSRISLLWQISKADITQTLRKVCRKVLHDHSVGPEKIEVRRQALLALSARYKAVAVDTEQALEDLLNRVGAQSGLFAPSNPGDPSSQSSTSGEGESANVGGNSRANDDSAANSLDKQTLLGLLLKSPSMGTKELIAGIDALGGVQRRRALLEKADLRVLYRTLVLERMSDSDLQELAVFGADGACMAGASNNEKFADRETLIRIIAMG